MQVNNQMSIFNKFFLQDFKEMRLKRPLKNSTKNNSIKLHRKTKP